MIRVELTHEELLVCRFMGALRTLNNRIANVSITGSTDEDDETGMIGEYAFGKHYNLFMDITLHPRKGGGDFVRNGKIIDVKATKRPDGNLITPLAKQGTTDVDVYVLAIVQGNVVDLIGYATRDDFLQDENIRPLGHSKGYFLDRSALRKLP